MTGFFAVVHFDSSPLNREALSWMTRRIAYRGQDHHAQLIDDEACTAFGAAVTRFTRESRDEIQPVRRDHVIGLAFAYLTERPALIQALRAAGSAHTEGLDQPEIIPDADLIVRAYLTWGEACVQHIQGDFVFVIWDVAQRRLFAARDRFGTRNLCYAFNTHPELGRVAVISTELNAIRLYPTVSSELNYQAIGDFLAMGSCIAYDKSLTVFRDISELDVSQTLTIGRDGLTNQTYWQLPELVEPIRHRTEQDYVEHYKDILFQVVGDRLRSETTLISLSGGMDSPSIAAAAAHLVAKGRVNTTLSAITAISDLVKTDDEHHYAEMVARWLDIPFEILRQQQHYQFAPEMLSATPVLPIQLLVGKSAYITAEFYAARGRISLIGNGADEMMTYSPLWDVLRKMPPLAALRLYGWLWRFNKQRPVLEGSDFFHQSDSKEAAIPKTPQEAPDYPTWFNPDFEREYHLWERWHHNRFWKPETPGMLQPRAYKKLKRLIWTMEGEFLYDTPIPFNMSVSPFLDLRFMHFALSLPPMHLNRKKYLMRQAMRGILPDEIVERPKVPGGPILMMILQQPESAWVDSWQPMPEMAPFVIRERVPLVHGDNANKASPQTHLRPRALNEWLQHYRLTLEQGRAPQPG
jgi:asparagine synthase (glutamine-hydrolysing)